MHLRLKAITWAFAVVLLGLGARLVEIQALHPVLAGPAEDGEQRFLVPARRGNIRDVHGTLLAQSRYVYDLRVDPVLIGTNAAEFARFAAPVLKMSEAELLSLVTPKVERRTRVRREPDGNGGFRTRQEPFLFTNRAVRVRVGVEPEEWLSIRDQFRTNFHLAARDEASRAVSRIASVAPGMAGKLRLLATGQLAQLQQFKAGLAATRRHRDELRLLERELRVNGVVADLQERRHYPLGGLAAHVLGHTAESDDPPLPGLPTSLEGAMGIEAQFDDELRGVPGIRVSRTGKGRELAFLRARDIPAKDGLNVVLTLDARIQSSVETALDEAVQVLHPKGIACVVIRPSTGEVLALGNRPNFDPNRYQSYPLEWRRNRVITDPVEPGSTFKMVTYAAAIDRGLAHPGSMVDCAHGIWSPPSGRPVRDVEGHGLGVVTVAEAFAKSSNVAAAKYGLQLPIPVLRTYAERMGYLRRTGLFYSEWMKDDGSLAKVYGGEHPGALRPANRINTELHGRISYGYGLYATPLQTAVAAATIANDGRMMRPHIVRRLTLPDGEVVREFAPEILSQAMRPETAAHLRRMMRQVVTDGTGKRASLDEYAVAGKTGTAHKTHNGRQSNELYVSTFVGFLPAEAPELCILVLVDEPRKTRAGSHYGGSACGPVFQRIARETAAYLALPPTVADASEVALAVDWDLGGR